VDFAGTLLEFPALQGELMDSTALRSSSTPKWPYRASIFAIVLGDHPNTFAMMGMGMWAAIILETALCLKS